MIKREKYPKIFNILFGEGMVNDFVSIILFRAVYELINNRDLSWEPKMYDVWFLLYLFTKTALISLLIGLFFGILNSLTLGMLSSLVLKLLKEFTISSIIQTFIILIFGFLSFLTSELMGYSGVISILVSGIVMSQYTFQNLDHFAKQNSK